MRNMWRKKPENILKPEEEVLILLARQNLKEDNIERIAQLFNREIDFEYLTQLAHKHVIAPLIGYHLSHNEKIKEKIFLDNEFKKNMILSNITTQVHNKKMYEELDHLQRIFDKHNVKLVILKGPALEKIIYKNSGARFFGDLDFLIAPEDIIKIDKILKNDGYIHNEENLSSDELLKTAESEFHLPAYNKEDLQVEIHHFGADWNLNSDVDYESIYNRASKFKINKESVWIPGLIDLFIWTCIHLEHHYIDKYMYSWPMGCRGKLALPLRLILDIRESYLFLMNNLSKDINLQMKDYSLLISKNVVRAEQIYGSFFQWSNLLPYPDKFAEELTWEDEKIHSYFLNRVISPEKEYDRLSKQLINKDRRKANYIKYKERGKKDSFFIIPDRQIYDDPFNFLFSKSNTDKLNIKAKFNMEWDNNYLYFSLSILNPYIKNKEKHNYNIQILFGKSKEFSTVIGFDPLKYLNSCFLAWRSNSKLLTKKISISPEIVLQNQEYNISLIIPWDYIGFSPKEGNEMLMDVQITEIKENCTWDELATITWATGDKYYMNSYFNICEEFIMNKVKLIINY